MVMAEGIFYLAKDNWYEMMQMYGKKIQKRRERYGGKTKNKRKENLTDIRNWTEILTPNVIITDLKVILVSYHT